MRLKFGHVCRFAETSITGMTLIGIFDYMTAGTQAEPDGPIMLPLFYLAARIGATNFEAGKHEIMIRLIDQDGVEGGRTTFPNCDFQPIAPDRELGAYLIHPVFGLQVPHYGDYLFEIWAGAERLGGVDFSVHNPQVKVPV